MSNQDTRRYVLRAEGRDGKHLGYWTGKAGEAWVCADGNEAYECSFDECLHKIALFNKRATLAGATFMHWFSMRHLERGKRRVGV
jgi:hypothetical protein